MNTSDVITLLVNSNLNYLVRSPYSHYVYAAFEHLIPAINYAKSSGMQVFSINEDKVIYEEVALPA